MSTLTVAQSAGFELWPQSASRGAADVDLVYLALLGLTLFFVVLIGALALGFGVKYRAGATPFRGQPIRKTLAIELTFIVAPLVMTLAIFVWGACSIRRWAAIRCSSSTSSGSTRTRRCTSWCCPRWAW